jgi:hypothetical protein
MNTGRAAARASNPHPRRTSDIARLEPHITSPKHFSVPFLPARFGHDTAQVDIVRVKLRLAERVNLEDDDTDYRRSAVRVCQAVETSETLV